MRSDAEAVVEGVFAALRLHDVAATLAYCADGVEYTVHQPAGVTGLGGRMVGKAHVRAYLEVVCKAWTFLRIEPATLVVDAGKVRGQTQFEVAHRRTGLTMSGRKRHVWQVEDGRVVACDEFQDAERIRAFLAMADAI